MATVERNSSEWVTGNRDKSVLQPDYLGPPKLHRVATVRRQQGLSLRSAARQMGSDVRTLREQERETNDMKLSDLCNWQQVLGVPLAELLEDPGTPLSKPVMERARMVRIMKSVKALVEHASTPSVRRLAETLVAQLVDMMPELEEVGAWHSVGQRRSLSEYGRAAERVVSDDLFQG
ncbi:MAG: helix-turn-helix transcriptional regulator [Planctomycetota bacterium]